MSSRDLDNGDEPWEQMYVEECGLSYIEYSFHPHLLTMEILDGHIDEIIKRLEYLRATIANKELAYRGKGFFGDDIYDEHCTHEIQIEIAYQILAIIILETGVYLPDKVRDEVLRIIGWENDKKWGWDSRIIEYRKRYLEVLRIALKTHNKRPGKKWNYF